MFKSLFINTTGANDWILQKIADDIFREAKANGLACRMGNISEYIDEDICFNMWWRTAVPMKKAKHNTIFITHTDDKVKENDLADIAKSFDSYICMSQEDAQFLTELGYDKKKIFCKPLPVRNNYIRPISVGIFSACYPDGRKNDKWFLDYCKADKNSNLLNFVFIGKGWGNICSALEEMNISYEWHNTSRKMPFEYQFQQNKLVGLDYYMYMGMDGGAMGTYDAYAMGVSLVVSNDGYHKAIPHIEIAFNDEQEFINGMSKIAQACRDRLDFFEANSASRYVTDLVAFWQTGENVSYKEEDEGYSVVEKRRSYYFPNSPVRMKQNISSRIRRYLVRKLFN